MLSGCRRNYKGNAGGQDSVRLFTAMQLDISNLASKAPAFIRPCGNPGSPELRLTFLPNPISCRIHAQLRSFSEAPEQKQSARE